MLGIYGIKRLNHTLVFVSDVEKSSAPHAKQRNYAPSACEKGVRNMYVRGDPILELWRSNVPIGRIAKMFGVSKPTIEKYIGKRRIRDRKKHFTKLKEQGIIQPKKQRKVYDKKE